LIASASRRPPLRIPATVHHHRVENGAQLETVKAAGHRDRGAAKLYDWRGYNPEKAVSCAT
jgi:hypothetical protein